ncbi:MAG: TIM barrel protein, partial [Rhodoferax sp.]|nr:TIM barrel protein [Rhodoferax sp.]
NLSMMYTELPFLQRFEAAAQDGFKGVEFLFPYEWPADQLAERLQQHGLQQVLFNVPPGGMDPSGMLAAWGEGTRGTAALPGREAEFRAGVTMALQYAKTLQCPRIHCMAGVLPQGADPIHAQAAYESNLHWAAQAAAAQNVTVLIEPINNRDMPGYFLHHQAHAHHTVAQVGATNLQVQMDLYHCQITEGDVATKLRHYLPGGNVGHVQIAGVPERQEPDSGELNYPYLFGVLDALGYGGWVGCEYRPRLGNVPGATRAGLGWLHVQR